MLTVDIRKRFGAFTLEVKFAVPTPGVLALFGRSGCGKSSTVAAIAGLLMPDAGSVLLDDAVLLDTDRRIAVPAERRRMGCVFQEARLFPHLSVRANLRYAERRAKGPAYVGMDEVTSLLGLAGLLGRRTHQLSGGERQRVAIGRALLSQPRLLLLDEPLAALDQARRDEVLPYLEKLRDRLAIPMVYVTHDFQEVLRMATHVALLDAGRVSAYGEVCAMSRDANLRALVGPDSVGAIVNATVADTEAASGLMRLQVGHGELLVQPLALAVGASVRVQVLARDVIVSVDEPRGLSVRNSLIGRVHDIAPDAADSDLVTIDVGGESIMARITTAATHDLRLEPGMTVWALVKTVSLRGRSFAAPLGASTSIAFPRA